MRTVCRSAVLQRRHYQYTRSANARLQHSSSGSGIALASGTRLIAFRAVTREEYAARRLRFAVASMPPNSVVVFPAADETAHRADIMLPFQQDTMLYHLFGLDEPMRRALSPPGCAKEPAGVQLTCAAIAKYATAVGDAGCHNNDNAVDCVRSESTRGDVVTHVFVPPPATDPGVLPWSEETRTLRDYERALFDQTSGRRELVHTNDLATIAQCLSDLLTSMTSASLLAYPKQLSGNMQEQALRPSYRKAMNPLPHLYVNLPRQLRWTGELLRLYTGENVSGTVPDNGVCFTHPLQALMHVLHTVEVLATSGITTGSNTITLRCSYQLPTRVPLLPGLDDKPTLAQQRRLREVLPSALIRDATQTLPHVKPLSHTHLALRLPVRLPTPLTDHYRLVKSPGQVRQHVCSAAATQVAFAAAMRAAQHSASEHAIHSALNSAIGVLDVRLGATMGAAAGGTVRAAYIPVVAVGPSATEIHYTANNKVGRAGDWLRLDAGVELDLVPTDCTRTFPVKPRPSDAPPTIEDDSAAVGTEACRLRRFEMYAAILDMQRALLRSVRSGVEVSAVADLHLEMTAALLTKQLGITVPPTQQANGVEMDQLVRQLFCAHSFGHFFGLDIHESPPPRKLGEGGSRRFRGGMMHTVEPGVYIPRQDAPVFKALGLEPNALGIPMELFGVGMQVEDDVLILPRARVGHTVNISGATSCPWTRRDYLDAICAVYRDLEEESSLMGSPCGDPFLLSYYARVAPSLERWRQELPKALWIAFMLVFTQRVALEGVDEAVAAVAADVRRIKQHYHSVESGHAPWFPFHVVVLTSLIPKDPATMAHVMAGQ